MLNIAHSAIKLEQTAMMQKFFLLISLIAFLACKSETPDSEPGGASDAGPAETPIEQLKARAVEEGDIYGRLQPTATVLQEEYSRSEKALPNLKNVQVSIDADCILTIVNQSNGGETKRINLRNLDPQGFSLIPDQNAGDFPGLRIRAREGASESELIIYMADRPAIERITPYLLQAVNICNE
jgi:hypothetical protein